MVSFLSPDCSDAENVRFAVVWACFRNAAESQRGCAAPDLVVCHVDTPNHPRNEVFSGRASLQRGKLEALQRSVGTSLRKRSACDTGGGLLENTGREHRWQMALTNRSNDNRLSQTGQKSCWHIAQFIRASTQRAIKLQELRR